MVLPIELVKPPSAAMPNGTLATTSNGRSSGLVDDANRHAGHKQDAVDQDNLPIHFHPWSFSGANM